MHISVRWDHNEAILQHFRIIPNGSLLFLLLIRLSVAVLIISETVASLNPQLWNQLL